MKRHNPIPMVASPSRYGTVVYGMSSRDFQTLYMELGARAFSDMAGEMSPVGNIIVTKRAVRATRAKKSKPKKATVASSNVLESTKSYAIGTILHVQYGQEVLMAKLLRYSKKGNLVLEVMDHCRSDIIVPRQDVLCSALDD